VTVLTDRNSTGLFNLREMKNRIFTVCFCANFPNSDPTIYPDYYQWYEAYESSDDCENLRPCALLYSANCNNLGSRIIVQKEFVRSELGSSAITKFINWQNSNLSREDLIA
jgi:hypothetical protein